MATTFYIIFYAVFFQRLSPVSPSATDSFFFKHVLRFLL